MALEGKGGWFNIILVVYIPVYDNYGKLIYKF